MTSATVSALMLRAPQPETLPRDPVHADGARVATREEHAASAFEGDTDAARRQLEEDFDKGHTEKASSLVLSSSTASIPVRFLAKIMVPGGESWCAAGGEDIAAAVERRFVGNMSALDFLGDCWFGSRCDVPHRSQI